MATTFAPQQPMAPASIPVVDETSPSGLTVPVPLLADDPNAASQSPLPTPQLSPRNGGPPPNPHFVFPARASPSSAPPSFSRSSGRRARSVMDLQDVEPALPGFQMKERPTKSPALPDFSFNPGASLPRETNNAALLSPPLSPQSPRPIPSPSRPGGHGHRRGGSEFVGGNIRAGEAITIMSTSPTKSESGFASPSFPPPMQARRKGHAHRRSAAISSNDLSLILQPPSLASGIRGSSAPTSPAEFDRQLESPALSLPEKMLIPSNGEPVAREYDHSTSAAHIDAPAREIHAPSPPPARAAPRARVGFSDTLEFIPRPVSLVSSDTSSTVTARPGHSVSGSISSIVSTTVSISERAPSRSTMTPSPTAPQPPSSRPSTASAVLERSQSIQSIDRSGASPRRRNSIPTLVLAPDVSTVGPPAPSPTKTPKRWSFFGLDPFSANPSPTRPRPTSASSSESVGRRSTGSARSSSEQVPSEVDKRGDSHLASQKKTGKKPTKKKKRVQNWAGSILTRKPKPRSSRKGKDKTTTATTTTTTTTNTEGNIESPLTSPADHEDGFRDAVQPEGLSPGPETPTVTVTTSDSSSPAQLSAEWKPRSASTPEDDASLPMIDLDAALGPFNTPLPRNPEWDAAQKAAGHTKRQLHSAQGMKGFSGPGMHYHRRAESAPEMVPFEGSRFGIHRFGSSSTMADVFEEDEEDDAADKTHSSGGGPSRRRAVRNHSSSSEDEDEDGEMDDVSSDDATPPAGKQVHDPIIHVQNSSAGPSNYHNNASRHSPTAVETDGPARPPASMRSERSVNSLQDEVIAEEGSCGVDFRTTSVFQDSRHSSETRRASPRLTLAGRNLAPVETSPLHLPTASHIPVSPYSMSHSSSFPSPRSPGSYDAQRVSTAPSSVNDENNFQSLLLGEPGPEVRVSVDIPSLASSNSTMTRESVFMPRYLPGQVPFHAEQRPASVSSAAFGRRRSSLASLSRLISSSHGERSKLSMEVTLDNDAEKKSKASRTKRLSRMMQFWKPRDTGTS